VTEFMRAHLAETLQLSELAAISGLSISHFSRAFKGSTGLPPHRWHLNMRIDRARKMLADASPSLADVAYATGFADQSHFTRLFSRIVGMSPGTWRRGQKAWAETGEVPPAPICEIAIRNDATRIELHSCP